MADIIPEIDGSSIVLLGSFNPTIFQPTWFARNNLLPEDEARNAKVEAITQQFTLISTGWLQLQVTSDRLSAATTDAGHALPLRDLVLGTFRILEHTPVRAMGLNRQMHMRLQDEHEWHGIGDTLAPKEIWRRVLHGRPGMRSLTIEGQREGSTAQYVRVTVQPSVKFPNGVFFDTNEHFAPDSEPALPALLTALEVEWELSQQYAYHIAERVILECGAQHKTT